MKASPNSDCVFVCNYVFISGHPFLPISTCIENYHSHKHDRKVFYLAASLSGASSIFSSDTFPFSTFPTESNADRFPLLATAPLKGTLISIISTIILLIHIGGVDLTQQKSCLHLAHLTWLHPSCFSIGDRQLGQC